MNALDFSGYKLDFRPLGQRTHLLCVLVTKSRMRDIEFIIDAANEKRRIPDQQPEVYRPSLATSQPVSYSQSWTFRYEIRASSPRAVLVVYKDCASLLPCHNRIRYRRKRFLLDEEWIVPNLLSRGACVCAGCDDLVAFRERDYDVDAWVRHRDRCSGIEKRMMAAVVKDLNVPRSPGERGPGEIKGTSLRAVRDFEDDEQWEPFGGGSSDEGADDENDENEHEHEEYEDEEDEEDEDEEDEDEDEDEGDEGEHDEEDDNDEDQDCRDGCPGADSSREGPFVVLKAGTYPRLRKPDTGVSVAC
ncbi:uncharacterized protein EV420DRAFT_124392 [Desarmillaria tabescens]|uniref:Uncharacterized protein n=1 Tax=Armillaria tabescens TaxID=1929756 RepID=A0AA39N9Z2_ARMTA|nr:uncharacterized protein EV420DRAFT_124392 [Desarmillaria tabescens]KAK0461704.1 hypothetical protein EV420DRAFT_124392 [Desarmillaria tabescens]